MTTGLLLALPTLAASFFLIGGLRVAVKKRGNRYSIGDWFRAALLCSLIIPIEILVLYFVAKECGQSGARFFSTLFSDELLFALIGKQLLTDALVRAVYMLFLGIAMTLSFSVAAFICLRLFMAFRRERGVSFTFGRRFADRSRSVYGVDRLCLCRFSC